MSKHTTQHYCRNTHCRAKLAAPVDNEHHAFCTSGCHAIFYRHRCLVCEDAMRRKRDDQRFKNGHKTCQNEYRRFPHVFDYPGVNSGHPTGVAMSASQTPDFSGSKVAVGDDLPRKMFWRDKAGRGWYWESEDLGETDCSAALAILRRVSMSVAENGCSLGRAFFPSSRRTLRMPVSGWPYLRRLLHCRLIR